MDIIRVRVGRFATQYPQWWTNFLKSLEPRSSFANYAQQLDQRLEEYNARVVDRFFTEIEFSSEQDYVYFLLKWS